MFTSGRPSLGDSFPDALGRLRYGTFADMTSQALSVQ